MLFSKNLKKVFVVQSLIHVQLFGNPWTAAYQASLSFTISQSLLKFMSKAQTHEFAQSLLKLMSQFRGRGGSPRSRKLFQNNDLHIKELIDIFGESDEALKYFHSKSDFLIAF